MGKNDVVKHDLTSLVRTDAIWSGDEEPVEPPGASWLRPSGGAPPAPQGKTITRQVTAKEMEVLPFCSVGKMRMRFDPLRPKGGSGWVVAPRAFITAGHCVYNHDIPNWVIEATFCPRFDGTCEKSFTVSSVYTLQGWLDGDMAYDLAACVVAESFTIKELPMLWSPFTVPELKYLAAGYPIVPTSEYDFNGKRMWRCQGQTAGFSNQVITMYNDFTPGASGGPWLEPPDAMAGGITSHRDDDVPEGQIQSPIFATGFQNLYDAVKNL